MWFVVGDDAGGRRPHQGAPLEDQGPAHEMGGEGGGLKCVESCIDSVLEMTVLENNKKKVSIMILIYS